MLSLWKTLTSYSANKGFKTAVNLCFIFSSWMVTQTCIAYIARWVLFVRLLCVHCHKVCHQRWFSWQHIFTLHRYVKTFPALAVVWKFSTKRWIICYSLSLVDLMKQKYIGSKGKASNPNATNYSCFVSCCSGWDLSATTIRYRWVCGNLGNNSITILLSLLWKNSNSTSALIMT